MIRTPEGIAVLKRDTHISRWVEQTKRLDHDGALVPAILTYLHPGDVAVDVGAFIGDHTIAYLRAVGEKGTVYAFEPNPEAFECLVANCPQAKCHQLALGAESGTVEMVQNDNAGAMHTKRVQNGKIRCITLDSLRLERLNFMKVDAEGDECKILQGAWQTIMRLRPVLVLEVADCHLQRQGNSRPRLIGMLDGMGYTIQQVTGMNDPQTQQYDILCQPIPLPK